MGIGTCTLILYEGGRKRVEYIYLKQYERNKRKNYLLLFERLE